MKKCKSCQETKEESEFPKNKRNKDGLATYCKSCNRGRTKEYYNRNIEESRAYYSNYFKNNPEKLRGYREKYYKNNEERLKEKAKNYKKRYIKYGVTLEEYNKIFERQKGCCAICGKHQSELRKALAVDHNHDTGIVRGLLCDKCNIGIGMFNDNKQLLFSAFEYLNLFSD